MIKLHNQQYACHDCWFSITPTSKKYNLYQKQWLIWLVMLNCYYFEHNIASYFIFFTLYRVTLVDPWFVRRMRLITSMVLWVGVTAVDIRTDLESMPVLPSSMTGSKKRCMQLRMATSKVWVQGELYSSWMSQYTIVKIIGQQWIVEKAQ